MERKADTVLIADDEADLKEVLADSGFPEGRALDDSPELRVKLAQLRECLQTLTEHELNEADGEVRARIGKFHFPLRKTIYAAVTTTVALTGAVAAAIANPALGGLAIAGVLIGATEKATDLISKLTDEELVVFEALGAAVKRNRETHTNENTASKAEVESIFDERDQAYPDVAAILDTLANDNRGVKRHIIGSESRYAIVN